MAAAKPPVAQKPPKCNKPLISPKPQLPSKPSTDNSTEQEVYDDVLFLPLAAAQNCLQAVENKHESAYPRTTSQRELKSKMNSPTATENLAKEYATGQKASSVKSIETKNLYSPGAFESHNSTENRSDSSTIPIKSTSNFVLKHFAKMKSSTVCPSKPSFPSSVDLSYLQELKSPIFFASKPRPLSEDQELYDDVAAPNIGCQSVTTTSSLEKTNEDAQDIYDDVRPQQS